MKITERLQELDTGELEGELGALIGWLQALQVENSHYTNLRVVVEYDYENVNFYLLGERDETANEKAKRIKALAKTKEQELKKAEARMEKEKAKYLKLKAKYEDC